MIEWNNIQAAVTGRIQNSPILRRLATGTFWALLATLAIRVFSVATTVVIARILGKENFGVLGLVLSTFGMFGILAGFSLGGTTTKYIAEYRLKDPVKAGQILSLTNTTAFITGGLVSGVVLASAPWLARETLSRAELGSVVCVGGLLLLLNALNNVQFGTLAGFEAYKPIAKVNLWQGFSTPLVTIPLVYWSGVLGAITAQSAVAAIGLILCRKAIHTECRNFNVRYRRFDLSALWEEREILWKFSIPSMASGFLVVPVTWICNMILVRQPNGYAELGLFNAANQWRLVIMILPQILASVMLPIFAEIHGRNNKEDFRHAFNINLSLTWVSALPLMIALIIFREPLSALFGKQYIGMSPIIILLMVTAFLNIVNNVVGIALAGTGRMWLGTTFNVVWAVALIIGTMIFVPVFGGMGMAVAYLISYVLHTMLQFVYTDIQLVPKLIREKYLLIAITLITILAFPVMIYLNIKSYFVDALILITSFIPAIKIGLKKITA